MKISHGAWHIDARKWMPIDVTDANVDFMLVTVSCQRTDVASKILNQF